MNDRDFEPPLADEPPPGRERALEPKPDWRPRYPGSQRLQGKVALITGGDSGIGRAVAALFAREGAKVAIAYFDEHDDAEETRKIVQDEGQDAILIAGDVGDPDFCKYCVQMVIDEWGYLDILVNNAGEQHPAKDVREIDEEQLRRTFQTNIFGMFWLTQAALNHMRKGAAIINCTSVVSYKGSEELLDYASTKGAITAFTRSLSGNLAEGGIRVNGVAPGPIWTPLNPMGGATPEKMKDFGQDTPLGRAGQPWEVAPSFLFLACEDSSYMTGQILHPNGGVIVNG
jgi:NAD(P)-dependent dehydrogenase (short-subunit alcohol dehydrogenase family)